MLDMVARQDAIARKFIAELEAENARLKAEVEILTKGGDAMADALWEYCHCQDCEEACDQWKDAKRAAKGGKQP